MLTSKQRFTVLGVLVLLLLGANTQIRAQVIEEWVARYNGPGNDVDQINSMDVDADGNVYVTGFATTAGTHWDYTTVKYNSAGVQQWVAYYNGTGNWYDEPNSIAVDSDGNVYVTGESSSLSVYPFNYDYATVKYNPDGTEAWAARYNGPGNGDDRAHCLSVDADGNVYVTGHSEGSGTASDAATVKYSLDGTEQWVARYDGPESTNDFGWSLALDDDGSVLVAGYSDADSTVNYNPDFVTIKYDASGVEQWVARLDNGDMDEAGCLALDGSGNVYVAGKTWQDPFLWDYLIAKYDADGFLLWTADYNGPGNESDQIYALVVDVDDNVVVTDGSFGGLTTQQDYATIKYNPDGAQQWIARYTGPVNGEDTAWSLDVDQDGNVYVTGQSWGGNYWQAGTSFDCATVKYDASGAELWEMRYHGPGNGDDLAFCLKLDAEMNVYVAGSSDGLAGVSQNMDYATIKYSQAAPLSITLTPHNPPIQIPASGGAFNFDILIENSGISPITCDVWTNVTLPNGQPYPILLRSDITLPAAGSILRILTQNVPPGAPAGAYAYNAYIGDHPDIVFAEDSFPFEKLGITDSFDAEFAWMFFGWEEEVSVSIPEPDEFTFYQAHPNPFNPATTINFSLPEASNVNLTVYDVSGRRMKTLIDDYRDAGIHEVIFNGSNLPSGIYIYRLTAANYAATGKMVLMK